jgi:hypothetical protein
MMIYNIIYKYDGICATAWWNHVILMITMELNAHSVLFCNVKCRQRLVAHPHWAGSLPPTPQHCALSFAFGCKPAMQSVCVSILC